jgi:N6-adenosine-specific RNA methylase IME4
MSNFDLLLFPALADTIQLTRTSLVLPQSLSAIQWEEIGRSLGKIEQATQWWIGDWWAFGEHKYGDRKALVESEEWNGPAFQTCVNAGNVCKKFESNRRRLLLSFKHHAEVASLAPAEADEILDWAEDDGSGNPRTTREVRHRARQVKIKAEPTLRAASDTHEIILADPPWRYDFSETQVREIENQYPTADVEEIIADSPLSAAEDSILFLWATAPKLREALQVMSGWGFEYKSHAIWDKQKIGMGYWFRGRHELLLVGTKGNPPMVPEAARVASIFAEPRGTHSEKPECVYSWIEAAFPFASKLEMYCRSVRPGWDAWGNEI